MRVEYALIVRSLDPAGSGPKAFASRLHIVRLLHLRTSAALLAFLALVATMELRGQSPAAEWRTVTTPHFRVHYTQDAAAWAQRAASRLEAVPEAGVKEGGLAAPEGTDVGGIDPLP